MMHGGRFLAGRRRGGVTTRLLLHNAPISQRPQGTQHLGSVRTRSTSPDIGGSTDWTERAACRNAGFDFTKVKSYEEKRNAQCYCELCPVRQQCETELYRWAETLKINPVLGVQAGWTRKAWRRANGSGE